MRLNEIIRNKLTNKAVVISKNKIAKNVFHLRIKDSCLEKINYKVGQHLHVLVQPEIKGSVIDITVNRNYSIWNHSIREGILDLAICNNSEGIGAKWIDNLKCKDFVYFTKPTGNFILSAKAQNHVFIGDNSALSHFYFMKRNLTSRETFLGLIYGLDRENYFSDLDHTFPFNFIDQGSNLIPILEKKIESTTKGDFQETKVYIGGNGDIGIELYRLLKEKYQLKKGNIIIKPFWRTGRKGL